MFEGIKDKVVNLFKGNNKNSTENNKKLRSNHPDIENSSLCSLLDEQERKNNAILRRKFLESSNTIKNNRLSTLTLIYLVLNISQIASLLFIKWYQAIELESDIKFHHTVIPNFFKLKNINPIVFNIFTLTVAVVGLLIILSLFIVAKLDRYQKIIKNSQFGLYALLVFGVISQIIQVLIAYLVFNNDIGNINKELKKETSLEIEELIFLSYLIFFELFGVFASIELYMIQSLNVNNYEKKENWTSYKVICLMYLITFTIIYLFVFLHKNNLIGMMLKNMKYIETYYDIILAVFPYTLHIIIGLFMVTFYNDLQYFSFGVYTKKSESEQMYDDNNKNEY